MGTTWNEFLDIKNHPFLQRFAKAETIGYMYEHAVCGLPPIYAFRPKHWYGRARSTAVAIERLGDMVTDRLSYANKDLQEDLLKVLEDCEDPGSIDLIEKVFVFYPAELPYGKPGEPYSDIPATEKQRGYLKRLGIKNFRGTKSEASRMIEQIKNEKEYCR